MGSINKVARGDDRVFEAVDANLAAGVLAIPSTTATHSGLQGIKVAGDAAKNVVGVTARSAVTYANQGAAQAGTGDDGYPFADVAVPDATLTCYSHAIVPVTYTAAAVGYGAKLAAAANGAVRAWVSGDGADAIVGTCVQPGGVSSAGGVALAKIDV